MENTCRSSRRRSAGRRVDRSAYRRDEVRGRAMVEIKTREFKQNARVALDDAQLQRALAGLPGGLVARPTARATGCRSSRICATSAATSATIRSRISIYISPNGRRRRPPPAPSSIGRRPPPTPARPSRRSAATPTPRSSPRASRWCRRRSASTPISKARAWKWSRPTSANISSRSARRRQDHIITPQFI